jgi:hypothetical protein
MKHGKISWTAALIVGGAFLATSAPAMENHAGHDMSGGMNHGDVQQMEGMEHGQGGMIMLGEEEQNGVKAMFHLMVMFHDAGTGKTIGSGTVAVKIESPDGKEAAPVKLMGMQGHFGADVNLDKPGIWHFRIATKLADGKVRQFHSHHVVK